MAILQTKYVAVGSFTYGSLANYGFNTDISIGTISNTSGGTSNVNLDSVYSGADVRICNWATTDGGSTGSVVLQLTGNRANSGWATMTVGSTTFSRTAATYTYDSNNNRTTWNWSSNSNPFGTSGNVKVEWDDGGSSTTYSLSASPTTVASGNNVTFSWTASTSGTYYYNTTLFGGASGSVSGTSGTFSATASSSFSGAQTSSAAATLRTGSTSGTTVAGPVYVTIDKTPGQPSVAASSVGETSFVGTATAGSPNVGTLQVSIDNSNWYTSPKTFTGLSAGTTYTLRARQVNGVAISSQGTTSVTTDSPTPTLDLNISIGTDPVLLNSSTTTYTNSLTGCGSNEIYFASYTAGASQGSTTTYSNLGSIVGRTYTLNSSRTLFGPSGSGTTISGPGNSVGDTVYIWAVLAPSVSGNNITSSTTMTYTGSSYVVDQPDTSITLTPSTTSLTHNDTTTNPTVNVTGDSSGTQYRLYTNNIPRWVSTYNGGGSATNDFTISYSESELPSAGNSYTYFSQARIPTSNGGSGTWQNTGDSFTITRQSPPASYSVSASPTSINEGQSTTFTVTTSNVANSTTVGYTLSGVTSGDLSSGSLTGNITINNNTGSVQFTFSNDATTEGSETATLTLASTDSNQASTGTPSASVTIADTSQGSSSGGGSGSLSTGSGAYGLEIRGLNGTAKVFTPGHRTFNVIAGGKLTLGSGVTTYPTALTNLGSVVSDETKISILVLAPFDGQLMIEPIRDATNGRIGFENTSGASHTFRYQVHRIG